MWYRLSCGCRFVLPFYISFNCNRYMNITCRHCFAWFYSIILGECRITFLLFCKTLFRIINATLFSTIFSGILFEQSSCTWYNFLTHTHTHTHTHTYIHTKTHTHTNKHIHTNTHIYRPTHMYIHMQKHGGISFNP